MNWFWIGLALTVQPLAALVVAIPFWRKAQATFGNIVGTAVIFASAIGMILREYVEIDRVTQACLEAGTTCWPEPSAFARFAIYASIGMGEIFTLFSIGLVVEERVRRRSYSPDWQ
jgi:hypothetical protein